MVARLMTLGIWAAVLASAVAWALPLFTRGTPVPAGASLAAPAPPAGGSLVRLLGQPPVMQEAEAPVVVPASRFQLVGVVAPRRAGGNGLALIAVDGKPAKPFTVGREIEPGLKLLTVAHRQVELGAAAGAPSVTLSLAPLPEAQRGRPEDLPGAAGAPGMMGMPGTMVQPAMPGAMRVPPMPGAQPQVVPPRFIPGAQPPANPALPGMARQGTDDGATLPYQADGSNEVAAPGGGPAGTLR